MTAVIESADDAAVPGILASPSNDQVSFERALYKSAHAPRDQDEPSARPGGKREGCGVSRELLQACGALDLDGIPEDRLRVGLADGNLADLRRQGAHTLFASPKSSQGQQKRLDRSEPAGGRGQRRP